MVPFFLHFPSIIISSFRAIWWKKTEKKKTRRRCVIRLARTLTLSNSKAQEVHCFVDQQQQYEIKGKKET